MTQELRERVARAIYDAGQTWLRDNPFNFPTAMPPQVLADAAIALIRAETLEEAARVAERVADGEAVKCRNALIDDEDDDIALRHADKEGGARDCAAAIRALKEGK